MSLKRPDKFGRIEPVSQKSGPLTVDEVYIFIRETAEDNRAETSNDGSQADMSKLQEWLFNNYERNTHYWGAVDTMLSYAVLYDNFTAADFLVAGGANAFAGRMINLFMARQFFSRMKLFFGVQGRGQLPTEETLQLFIDKFGTDPVDKRSELSGVDIKAEIDEC